MTPLKNGFTKICHGSFEPHTCFIRWLALGNLDGFSKRMVRAESLTSQLRLELGLEAGRCEFRGEFRLGARVVLRRTRPLSFSYYAQVNAER